MTIKKISTEVPSKTGIEAAKDVFATKTEDGSLIPAMNEAESLAMYGDLRTSDFTIPRLVILEGLSPQVTKEKAGHPGDIYVNSLKLNLGSDPVELVILRRIGRQNLLWKPLKDGGGILCQAKDGKFGVGTPGGECAKCSKSRWTSNDGKQVAPECDENQAYIVIPRSMLSDPDAAFPYAMSGAKARLQAFKDLNMLLMNLIGRRLPLYAKSVVMTIKQKDSKSVSGAVYHVPQFDFGNNNGILPESEIRAAQSIASRFATANIEETVTESSND